MIFTDFLLDSTGDLLIANGDFVSGPSDNQHIQDIINFNAGFIKQYPQVGVGVQSYVKSQNSGSALEQSVKQQLQSDGYQVNGVSVTYQNGGLKIVLGTLNNPVVRP
jgi:hypothetical protein